MGKSCRAFSSENRFKVVQVRDLLQSYRIPCFIKNEYAIGGVGEISPFDAWPEVWLLDDEWLPRVKRILADFEADNGQQGSWQCRACGECNEGSFEICWQCGGDSVLSA
ncbi:MAG: DUF2007 domain-containing protein [Aestuariibacter sp.]